MVVQRCEDIIRGFSVRRRQAQRQLELTLPEYDEPCECGLCLYQRAIVFPEADAREMAALLRPMIEPAIVDDAEIESTDIETLELESPPREHQDLIDSLERAANAPGLAA